MMTSRISQLITVLVLLANMGFAQTADGDTVLQISDTQLSGITVTARSKALIRSTKTGAINLTGEKLSNMPSLMGTPDINKILQLMPGVQHAGDANGHLYVRGGDPGHNLMLYNNVPIYGSSHLVGIFPFYNIDHIDRVHFDKSGSQTPYGDRLGATVQCFSPDEKPNDFSVKGNVGLLASQITTSMPLGKKAGSILSGRQTYVDQIVGSLIRTGDVDDFSYSFTDANFTLMLRPSKKHRVDVNLFATGDRFSLSESRILMDGSMKWGNQLGSVSWAYQFRPDGKIYSDIYFSRCANFLEVEQAGLDLQLESGLLDLGFNTGADFSLASIPFTTGIRYANYRAKPQDLSSETLPVPTESNKFTAQLVSAYLHGKPKLNEYFSLDAGLRLDLYDGNSPKIDLCLEPRISLHFSDDYKWSAYLSYARKSQRLHLITTSSVGFPTDFWLPASEGIPIALANTFSTGSNYKILPGLELSTGLYYSRMNNLVYYPLNVLQFAEMTDFSNDIYVGKGKARGAEFMLTKTGRLSGWLSYTLNKSDRQFEKIDNGKTFPSKFDRRHDLSAAMIYEIHKRWQVGLTQVFTSGSRFTVPTSWYFINNNPVKEYGRHNNATMPNYIRTDISVDFRIKKTDRNESTLNFSVFNLFAINNPTYVTLDIKPSETGNVIKVYPRYKTLYTILPSVSWRFRF